MKALIGTINVIKFLMLATITFCCMYLAMWFQHYEPMIM